MSTIAAVIGRILIAISFIVMGLGLLTRPALFETMITEVGLPGGLAIPAGLLAMIAGVMLALGVMTRLIALLLFGFVGVVAVLFHLRPDNPYRLIMLLFDLAVMGGLLMVFAHSQIWWSFDHLRRSRKRERELQGEQADMLRREHYDPERRHPDERHGDRHNINQRSDPRHDDPRYPDEKHPDHRPRRRRWW